MKNKSSSFVMRLLVTLLTVIGWQTGAWATDVVTLFGDGTANNFPLENGKIYVPNGNVTYRAYDSHNAMAVDENATATIYIPKGVKLKVYGADASDSIGAGAGIYVPTSSTLIITGEGTLVVSGGKASGGGDGGNGGDGLVNGDKGAGGKGGDGGYGGGGAAAAIGGYGGDGYGVLIGPDGKIQQCNIKTFDSYEQAGYNSRKGADGAGMGKVYILGTVTVNATAGAASTAAGTGGKWGSNDRDKGFNHFYNYAAGGGGPGGGGGSGYGGKNAIGGGAPGAQCGATGSSGGTYVSSKVYSYVIGYAGKGGQGAVNGGETTTGYPSGSCHKNDSCGGKQSSDVASYGGDGELYTADGRNLGGRSSGVYTIDKLHPMVKASVNFAHCGGTSLVSNRTFVYGVTPEIVSIPVYANHYFLGYYTEKNGGTRIFNANGEPTGVSTFTSNTTLYAHWTITPAVNETTGKVYVEGPQQAINEANTGDVINLLVNWSEKLEINKAINVNLNGNTFGTIKVGSIGSGTATISNGKIDKLKGVDGLSTFASGTVVCNALDVDVLYADGHSVIINSGIYANVRNLTEGDVSKLNNVTIKGEDTYVGKINVGDIHCGPVTLIGGNYKSNPVNADHNVSIPANCEVVKLTEAAEGAPSKDYIYKVGLKSGFANYITLRTGVNTINTWYNAKKNYKVTCHFSLNSIDSGYNTIFGSSEEYVGTCHRGFGLYVDSEDNSFVFAAGTEFQRSPAGLAKPNQDYYVTMSDRYIRIDTVADASSDYYHKEIVQYQFRENNNAITIGGMTGGGLPEVHNMNLYSFAVYDGEILLSDFRPAYGYQKEDPTKDFWLYDIVKNNGLYDWGGNAVPYGAIAECTEHLAYRIKGNGSVAVRMCVICGQISAVEDFIQSSGELLTPTKETGAKYEYHYAKIDGDMTEFTKTVTDVPTLKNMKLFGCKVWVGEELKHNYVPMSSCGGFYFYDEVTGAKIVVSGATSNISANGNHEMMDKKECDGIVSHVCKICGMRNNVNELQNIAFNTGINLHESMWVRLCMKVNQISNDDGSYIFGQWKSNGFHVKAVKNAAGDGYYLMCYNSGQSNKSKKTDFELGKYYWVAVSISSDGLPVVGYWDDTQMKWVPSNGGFHNKVEEGAILWLGADHESCLTRNDPNACDISINECIITGDNKEQMHLYPSQYGKRPRLYDATMGKIIDATCKSGVELNDNNYNWYATIIPCEEHQYLSPERHEKNGAYYRYCMICNAEVKDTRNYIRTNRTAYFKTDWTPSITTEVRTDFEFATTQKDWDGVFGTYNAKYNKNSFFFELTSDNKVDIGWEYTDIQMSTGRLYNLRFTKNNFGLYNSATATSSFASHKSNTQYTAETFNSPGVMWIGTLNGNGLYNDKPGDIIFYDFNIIDTHLQRRYLPAKRGDTLGLYEVVSNKFLLPEGSGLTGVVNTCEKHLYCDYTRKVEENEEVWERTCRICGYTDYYKGSKPFVANNGAAWFKTGVTATSVSKIEVDVDLVGENKKWNWCGGNWIQFVEERDVHGQLRISNLYSMKLYVGNKVVHHYLPSCWNDSIGFYDVVTDKFTEMSNPGAASAYIPTCQYHRYFDIETKEVNGMKTITKHCKLCDAHVTMNGIKVDSQDVLKNYLYNGDSLTISVEMLNNETGETVVTTDKQYPEIKKSSLVFGVAIMDEGKLIDYFVPAIRKNGPSHSTGSGQAGSGQAMGMFNAAKEEFINIPNADVYISDCGHSYYRNDYVAGDINTHCYVCDETIGTIGYYKDITYNAHGGRGSDVGQRITSLKKDAETGLFANPFTYGAHFFAGWNTQKGWWGTAYKPGDKMPISATDKGNVTLYAQWNDGFICNGDTLEVNAKNTADIRIIDDDFNNFEATAPFEAKHISYERTLDKNTRTWGTLCLPFPIKSDDNMQFYTVNRYTMQDDGAVLILDSCQTISAGEPCIYHLSKDMPLQGDTLLVVSADNVTVGAEATTHEGENIDFTGTYRYITFECDKYDAYYAIQNDHFYRVKTSMTVRPFRAYLHTPEKDSSAPVKIMLWSDLDETDAIRTVGSEEDGPAEWYTTDGIRVQRPISGNIYIIRYKSGKTEKVLVR